VNDITDPVALQYARQTYEKQLFDPIGSAGRPTYKPHELLSNPPRPEDITLELLLASGAHLGHATQLWHPGNSQYIFGVRGAESGDPIHIISLDVTASHLRRACKVVESVAENGGVILFVGTRNGQSRVTVKAASMAKGCHLFSKWIPGSITNGQQILGNCAKKVVNKSDQEMDGFDDQLDDYAAIKPDLVVCLNPVENYILLRECGQHGIPTIGIVDTDCNPTWVTYPIPANDDSPRCVQVIAGALGRAGQAGHRNRLAKGVATYKARHNLQTPKGAIRPKARQAHSSAGASSQDHEVDIERDLGGVPVDQFERDQELFALLGGQLEAAPKPSQPDFASEDAEDAAAEAFSSEDNVEASRIISQVEQSESAAHGGNVKTSASGSVPEDDVKLDIREEDYVQLQGRPSEEVMEAPEKSTEEAEGLDEESDAPSLSKAEIEAVIQAEVAKRMAAQSRKKSGASKKATAAQSAPATLKPMKFDTSEFDLIPGEPESAPAAPVVAQAPKPQQKQEESVEQTQGTIEFASDAATQSTPTQPQQKVDIAQVPAQVPAEQPQGTIEFASDQVAAAESAPAAKEKTPSKSTKSKPAADANKEEKKE
jgi:ribosomal protein S2